MNKTKIDLSLNDTTNLRNLIIENPELPLLIFCGEDSWHDEYPYERANVSRVGIKTLTLYNNYWLDKDDYEEQLFNDLCDKPDYKHLSDEDYIKMIDKKVKETEFVKAIVIYVG